MPKNNTRLAELVPLLQAYREAYYNNQPLISDEAYDALEDELRTLAPDHPFLSQVGAPVGVTFWPKEQHSLPMGSLNKAVTERDLRRWVARCSARALELGLPPLTPIFAVTEKLDGISLAVNYVKGALSSAVTRGDGQVGENITPNVMRMQGVPHMLTEPVTVSLRGEVILTRAAMQAGFPDYTGPARNKANGTAKRFDGAGCEHLTVAFYDLEGDIEYGTEVEKAQHLARLGAVALTPTVGGLEDVLELHRLYTEGRRETLGYDIDGLVVRFNDVRAQHLLGELGGRPRGAVAFKFPSAAARSRVVAITWETGPSGRVTPVAQVEPVMFDGVTVQYVSLHNATNVARLGVGVGHAVCVSRRNDVIPYLEDVFPSESDGPAAVAPATCAVCTHELTQRGEYLVCVNTDCPAVLRGRIQRWVSVQNILEWGDKLIAQLVDGGLVREPADLYRLVPEDIAVLERRGPVIAAKLLTNLHAQLPLSLPVFLAALGIDDCALETAKLLVSSGYDSLDKLFAATAPQLAEVRGLGDIKAQSIVRGLAARADEIQRLHAVGVVPAAPSAGGPLAGQSFCFTGALSRPRKEYEALVTERGGTVLAAVTKGLTFLVLADPNSGSTKAEKAKRYGTQCIDEAAFTALMGAR